MPAKLPFALLRTFTCLMAVASVSLVPGAKAEPPDFHDLVERQMSERLRMNPQLRTSLGVEHETAGESWPGELDNSSLPALQAEKQAIARWREEILARDPRTLDESERLTYAIALRQYDGALERAEYPYAINLIGRTTFAIDHMHGPQTSLPRFMKSRHQIVDVATARNYVRRLAAFRAAFDGWLSRMEMQRQAGVVPPRFVIRNVLKDARVFITPPPAKNPLVVHLADRLESIRDIEPTTREELLASAVEAMRDDVYPAFERLIHACEALEPGAGNQGVWALPDGLDYYDTMLRVETTTEIPARQIHDMGLTEVARIGAEMEEVLRNEGLTEGTIGERVRVLADDPKHLFANDAEGRAQLVRYLEALLDDMHERQKRWFGTLPRARVVVERVPEFAEASQTIAYYGSGSIDGSRPGTYFINLRDTRDMPRWSLPSLSYHEAIPGHHLQIMIARELDGLPLLRRAVGVTGFVEGWALYAERLAWEMGAYDDDPLGNLGRLQYEMWRAVRMVVDTGIHVKRWSKERAISYFIEKTGMSVKDATTEIERYFVTPGSAPAYKLGMLKILELREEATQKLGADFDMGEFHDVVLRNGPLPLSVLEEVAGDWIENGRR